MEAYIAVQQDLNKRISKAHQNFKKSPKERLNSEAYISTRLEALEELWAQFGLTHTQIIQESDSKLATHVYITSGDGLYAETEELYIEYKYELRSALNKLKYTASTLDSGESTVRESKANELIKLPKISIPIFSGCYSEWISFRDLFKSMIHDNRALDNVQKLHYLKGYLSGEAEQLLRHVQITQDNYITCWEQLERRYNNKKYLSNCILKRFMSQRNITTESASALKDLLDTTSECLHALQNLGIDISTWDVLVIHIICLKLDNESRKQWELKVSESLDDLPTLKQFKDFLETRFRALEFIDPKLSKTNSSHKSHNIPFHNNPKVHHITGTLCAYCSEGHKICYCKSFAKADLNSRRDFIQSSNLCFNCLGAGHNAFSCRQPTRCRICKRKHHSLLHPKNVTGSTETEVQSNQAIEDEVATHATATASSHDESSDSVTTCFSTSRGQVLLATALVKAQSKMGSGITLRCLIDQGSQASFITESAVQRLGLKKIAHRSSISGLGTDEGASIASKSRVTVKISSLLDPNFEVDVNALVLRKLTSFLPSKRIVVELWSELSSLKLADPSYDVPSKVDILLGADIYGQILLDGIIKAPQGSPVAQRTSLGWILSGSIQAGDSAFPRKICTNHIHISENDLLKKFWEMESDNLVIDPRDHYTDEERKCEELFAATTQRDNAGRYIVKLPFRDSDPGCTRGQSEKIAARRFGQLEKRFAKDHQLKTRYSQVINEYIELGHMESVPEEEISKNGAVYLPHHAVIRDDKLTSKLRVVFDASCPGINGVSLNQDLLVGPSLQPDLRHIILRWRTHPICLVSDIVKMYRQVKIAQEDIDFQRVLWRENPQEKLKHMRILRVTFGTASAPYLAVRALQQVAYDKGERFPLAAERVLKHFYMDDLLTGCESLEEGKQIYRDITQLLQMGGFELQKWSSNSEQLMKEFNESNKLLEGSMQLKIDTVMKILGLTWNRSTDEFEYSVQLPPLKRPITKRSVISDIARLFDPLGWLAPVIITAKIFIQKLWLSGIEWDTEVPPLLLNDWLSYRENLNQLTKFKLPRWVHMRSDDQIVELQGFSDASSEAFAAVVYARTINKDGKVHVSLVTAKTKVAPIKQISIPRLELCGAVLLTKLLKEVADVMNIDKMNIHAWTDSSVVLSWLNSRPNKWKTFVANRVSEIISSIEPSQWSHVSSKDNPADCASRGTHQLENEPLWKEGPLWLQQKDICYNKITYRPTTLEKKPSKNSEVCLLNTSSNEDDRVGDAEDLITRFSKLRKLIRVVAFCKRVRRLARHESVCQWLTSQEIQDSLTTCIRIVQENYFIEEVTALKEKKSISRKSKLTSLNPKLDDDGILRVHGRLDHSSITDQMKHPIILPSNSHFTKLIIDHAHDKTLHGNPQLMLNYIKSRYFIFRATNLVKDFVRKCVICARYNGLSRHPFMGQLPAVRGTPK